MIIADVWNGLCFYVSIPCTSIKLFTHLSSFSKRKPTWNMKSETLNSGLPARHLRDFLEKFRPSIDFIKFLFSKNLALLFCSLCPVTILSEFIYSFVNSFSIWNRNILKFISEFCFYFPHGVHTWTFFSIYNYHWAFSHKK